MAIDQTIRSPNYGSRQDRQITMLVLHATAGNARSALAWLTNPAARVSAHYLIDKTGHIYQLVPDESAAWHAGKARWRDETAINEISIGIELENANTGRDPYPPEQIEALLTLARQKVAQYRIAPDMVVRHVDVAMPRGRKSDPAGFPWAEFLNQLFPQSSTPARDRRSPPVALPADEQSALARLLRAEAYRQVGAVYQPTWAMSTLARTERLGMPVGPSFDLAVNGRSYIAQSFGKDTLISLIGDWDHVERMSALVTPERQPLHEALLHAVYAQADETYHPEWAFHQYALRSPLGPPLGPSFRFEVEGSEFVAECYALDTVYSPVGKWREINRLNDLLKESPVPQQPLARELLEYLYRRAGSLMRLNWSLQQYAIRHALGAPLGPTFRVSVAGRDYAAEAYALDVIYCEIGAWDGVAKLSDLAE